MNNIKALLNRRFSDLSSIKSHKEQISTKQQVQMPPSTVPTNNDTKEENGFLEVTTDAQDDSIIWHPASEFLQQEDIAAYSFLVSPFIIDPATTDGIGFSRIVECLTQQLKLHVDKANSLISSNEKKPLFTEGVEEHLRVAIGRTQLLLNKRMKQFCEQLNRHLNPVPGQKITKLNDLHGLWALIDMQLEDIRACFNKIEKCRLNNWSELSDDSNSNHL